MRQQTSCGTIDGVKYVFSRSALLSFIAQHTWKNFSYSHLVCNNNYHLEFRIFIFDDIYFLTIFWQATRALVRTDPGFGIFVTVVQSTTTLNTTKKELLYFVFGSNLNKWVLLSQSILNFTIYVFSHLHFRLLITFVLL